MAADAGAKVRGAASADTEQVVAALRAIPLFRVLGEEGILATARAGTARRYAAGQFICYQGDPGDRLYVILDGLVKIVFTSERGDEMVLNTQGKAEISGELAVLDGSPRSASIVAVEPTYVFMLPRAQLLDLIRQHPALADEFLRMLGQRVRRLTEQAGDLAFLDLAARLAKLLLQLAEKHGRLAEGILDRRLTQSDLAAMIGASRPAVNRALQSLAARGLIAVQGQSILLRDVAGLRRRAER
jgi:CRP/FNR family cyclic AMP-dependent transcriptional regulator